MYSVLIVDDEPLVQVGLQSMVDWAALDARLLPCASNGQAALDAIRTEHPDLVITDIRMPLMDGLELIRRCRAEFDPSPEFVVLTSFEDFAFVREAMKHQVVDYLIKLEISPEILQASFAKARQLIDAKHTRLAESETPLPGQAFRDRVLFGLLDRAFASEAEIRHSLDELGIELRGQYYLAATCRLSEGDEGDHGAPRELRSYFYTIKLVREILSREYQLQVLPYNRTQFVLLLACAHPAREIQAMESRFQTSIANSLQMAQRYFNCQAWAGLGTVCTTILPLAESWQESLKALDLCTSHTPVVQFRSPGSATPPELSGDAFRKNLEKALASRDTAALHLSLGQARSHIEAQGKLSIALDLCAAALHSVLSTQSQGEALLNSFYPDNPDGYKCLYTIPSLAHVLHWLDQLEAGLVDWVENRGSGYQENLVQTMKKWVETHYQERIQLKAVADLHKLSPNYAGVLFRKHAGIGFSEYVAEVKIAHAKELLASRKYRIYEISDLLGFENSYYFSKVFRRVTGTSPREHQSQDGDRVD